MTEFTTTYQRGKTLQDINIEAFLERVDEFVQDHPTATIPRPLERLTRHSRPWRDEMDRLERAKRYVSETGASLVTDNGYSVKHLMADFAASEVRAERARIAARLMDLVLQTREQYLDAVGWDDVVSDFITELEAEK